MSYVEAARKIGLKGFDAIAHCTFSYLEINAISLGLRALFKMLFTSPYLNAIRE